MSAAQLSTLVYHCRRLATQEGSSGLPDAQLLHRWVKERDEAAFELLLWRHGPMLLGLCRRLLSNAQDVEDAFQATILTLVRKANSICKPEAVGSWLYKVAYRVALRLRAKAMKRAARVVAGTEVVSAITAPPAHSADLGVALDEEINRLPAKYRAPVVLCYLEGKTNEAAALELGCAVGTVYSRLATARRRLQICLTRRGITVRTMGLTAVLGTSQTSKAMAGNLVNNAVKVARWIAAGRPATEVVSGQVLALAEGVLPTMWLTRLQIMASVVLGLGLAGAGAGAVCGRMPAEPIRDEIDFLAAEQGGDHQPLKLSSQHQGVLLVIGTEIKPDEKVPAARLVTLKIDGKEQQYRRLVEGDFVQRGQLLARLDDHLARNEAAIKKAELAASEAELLAAEKVRDEAMEKLRQHGKVLSVDEVRSVQLGYKRFTAEVAAKQQAVKDAQTQLRQAQTIVELHEIRSPARGVISKIYKQQGEGVKQLEPIFRIEPRSNRADRDPELVGKANRIYEVPSQRDGTLVLIGTEIKPGEQVDTGQVVSIKLDGQVKRYRSLKEGDKVEPNQLLARLDDRLAREDVEIKKAKLSGATADLAASVDTLDEANQRYKTMKKLDEQGADIPRADLRAARLAWERYKLEEDAKKALVRVAELELKQAQAILERYEIRSISSGVIKAILKRPGEGAKYLEPVFRIQVNERDN